MSSNSSRSYRRGGDKTRRARWLDAVAQSGVSRGAVAWAVALAQRSNASAKPVWGLQTGQARAIGCSDRQVRRYRAELEGAGLIRTVRAPFERAINGTIGRMFTNVYQFVVAPLERRKTSSDRADIGVRSNPSVPNGTVQTFPGRILILDDGYSEDDFSPDGPFIAPAGQGHLELPTDQMTTAVGVEAARRVLQLV